MFFYLFAKYFAAIYLDFSWVDRIVSNLPNFETKFEGYVDKSEHWFSESAADARFERNYYISALETVANCFLIYLTTTVLTRIKPVLDKKAKQNLKLMVALFYCFVFGSCFLQMFHNIELFRRIFNPLYYFWCFPLSFVMTYKSLYLKKIERKMLIPILLFYCYGFFRYLFMRNGETLFLWEM